MEMDLKMQNINSSQINQKYILNKQNAASNPIETGQNTQQVNDGDNKMKKAFTGLAIAGAVVAAGVGIYKGVIKPKKAVEQITDITQDGIGKLLKENDKLTGKFQKTMEDGSKVVMEYTDGILQKSTKTAADGTQIFEKVYSKAPNGDLLVNNKNITEISKQVREHQNDFTSLMKKQDVSLDELKAFNKKNLSENQIQELDLKIKTKQDAIELEVKKAKEAEELAKKQAHKAQECAAKEAQERAQKAAIDKQKGLEDCDYNFSFTKKQGVDVVTHHFTMRDKKYAITVDKNITSGGDNSRSFIQKYSYPYGHTLKRIQIDGEDAVAKHIEKELWEPNAIIDSMSASQDISAARLCLQDRGMSQERIKSLLSDDSESTMLDIFQDAKTYAKYQIKAAYDSTERMQKEMLERCEAQPKAGVLYRAMDLNNSSELSKALKSSLSKGDRTVLQYNPMYTTPDFNYMLAYKNSDILKINVPAGAHVAYGGETLLPGMSQFEFVRRKTVGDMNFYELNYIPFEAK